MIKNNVDEPAFLCAAWGGGNTEVLEWLLDNKGVSIHEKNSYGNTALLIASIDGNIDLMKWLLGRGASLSDQTRTHH